jgi:hypothetical protein
MLPVTEQQIRSSFVNASRKEVSDLTLPLDFASTDWDRLDFFGWRDRKSPRRAYFLVPIDHSPVAVLLERAQALPRSRAQCSWCQDVNLSNEVVFYGAKRAGRAGRNGDSVGILVCANFGCCANVRKRPPLAYAGFDVDAAREQRIIGLGERVRGFARAVLGEEPVSAV